MAKHVIIPIFVPHLGCPHDCVFCNQSSITGLLREDDCPVDAAYVRGVVDEHLATVSSKDAVIEVSFFGGTFTGIDKMKQRELLSVAKEYKIQGRIHKIRLSTRPDSIDLEILAHLKTFDVDIIELGVQSLIPDVLHQARRGHGVHEVQKASHWIKAMGFQLGHQLMIGLPGDTPKRDALSVASSIAMRPDFARIYPALVLKNTALEKAYSQGEFEPYSLENAVEVAASMMEAYESAGIPVIRVGLQPTHEIQLGVEVVSGPFHPAFRELCESKRLADRIQKFGQRSVEVRIGRRDLSKLYADKKRYFLPLLKHMDVHVTVEEKSIKGIIEVKAREVTVHVS